MRSSKYSLETRMEAVADLAKGVPAVEVAKKFKAPPSSVYNWKYTLAGRVLPRDRTKVPEDCCVSIRRAATRVADCYERERKAEEYLKNQRKTLAYSIKQFDALIKAKRAKDI